MSTVVDLRARSRQILAVRQYKGETASYTAHYGGMPDTSAITTSTWAADDTAITFGTDSTGDHTATVPVSCTSAGTYRITNTVDLTDGATYVRHFDLTVLDTEREGNLDDYQEA